VRDVWVKDLHETLGAVGGSKILVAHSLGCSLVIEWAADYSDDTVVGAFLVAPPDVHGPTFPAVAAGFGSPRYARLPFKTVVVASEDDPYGSLAHASTVAELLGARLSNVGRKGHINAESGLADWPEGRSMFVDEFR
jgi:serine hydrolase